MREALTKLKKLRGRSLDELRVRGAQALAALSERRGLGAGARLPSDARLFAMLDPARVCAASGESVPPAALSAETLLAHFRARARPAFFAAFADPEATRAELRRRFGAGGASEVVRRASAAAGGRFSLLGFGELSFGDPVDWHLEPVAGRRAPLTHWSTIDYLDAEVAGDKKITWELNRHQYFLTLGRAYWHTGDELYARTFVAHLGAWIDANPPKLGINWSSSLEVAFRLISWLWALHFFKDSPSLTPAAFLRALKLLGLHARHVETYLSTYFSPNTHLTGEALALFYAGTLLPEFRAARRWRATGRGILLEALARHVRPDGVYFEQSSYYHRYTTDFYTHFLLLARAGGDGEAAARVEEKLTALLDHLMFITRPDGTTPLFGDDDGGRLAPLDERAPDDFRSALATGAAVFNRGDFKYVAGAPTEEALWLLGAEGLRRFDALEARPPADESRAFPEGGYYVMRDGWHREANYMLLDCGPHGADGCGHAHADALGFDLAARGRTLLVDPGTYTYTGARELRDWFRGTAAHNTLTVDGQPSSAPAGPFKWGHVAHARTRRWLSLPRFDLFEGEHDGYLRLDEPARHARAVLFLKGDYWLLRDRVETEGGHRYELRFHFAADASPAVEGAAGGALMREGRQGAPGLEIFVSAGGAQAGGWRTEPGWVSRCYRARERAEVGVFTLEAGGAQELLTLILPHAADQAGRELRVRELAATGGRSLEVRAGARRDVWLLGDGAFLEAGGFGSDFEWAWARMAEGGGGPDELILIGGTRLTFEGHEVFRAEGRVGHAVVRRVGDELSVEADARGEVSVATLGASRVLLNGAAVAPARRRRGGAGAAEPAEVEAGG